MAFQRVGVIVVMGMMMSVAFLLVLNGQLFSSPPSKVANSIDDGVQEATFTEEKLIVETGVLEGTVILEDENGGGKEVVTAEKLPTVPVEPEKPRHPRSEVNEISTVSVGLVIMEGSQRPGFDGAIRSVILNTPYNWPLYVIFPSTRNPGFSSWVDSLSFKALVKDQQRTVIYRDMPDKYYGQSQNVPASDVEFWNSFSEEWILLFQADSSMCGHPSIHLKDFFKYDYMGAPWRQFSQWDNEGNGADYYGHRVYVGNGGFSLRRRAFMVECLNRGGFHPPEDTFFALCAQQHGRAASTHEAMPFSSEQIATPGGALAIHGICTYRFGWGCDPNWVSNWLKTCPESSFLFPNNNRCSHC